MIFNINEYLINLPVNITEIKLNNKNLTSIPDLSKFINLKILNCSFNKITSIPSNLPDSLEFLYMYDNDLTELHDLPSNLDTLCCCHNKNLTYLPNLPNKLKKLCCYYNNFTNLPPLPNSLITLYICFNNRLTSLPLLPDNLEKIYCYQNHSLSSLPILPNNLRILECFNNKIEDLPNLPDSLETLICNNNKLRHLPSLPNNLIRLECSENLISFLPILSDSLELLLCEYNQLSYLPDLPISLKVIRFNYNPIYEVLHDLKFIFIDNYTSSALYINIIRQNIKKINNFRFTYYLLKFKRGFWDLLWIKVREPKIREYYSPENLIIKLKEINIYDENKDENMEIMDNLLNNW